MKKTLVLIAGGAVLFGIVGVAQQVRNAGNNWPLPGGDPGSTRFSTLTQINTSNVAQLKRAWTFRNPGRFASAPMVIDSVMYFSAPNGVFAVDAVTGTQIWKFAPPPDPPAAGAQPAAGGGRGAAANAAPEAPAPARGGGAAGAPDAAGAAGPGGGRGAGGGGRGGGRGGGGQPSIGTAVRGPVYWAGANGVGPRIYTSTTSGLTALDAKTGEIVRSFGTDGKLPGIRHNSPPAIFRNLLISRGDNEPGKGNTVKAFDITTGAHRWTFYTKAQVGDPNRASWLNGSAESDASPGMWGMFTSDEARGLLFFPVEKVEGNGANDYWGGGNHGPGLYSDSLIALDGETGKMKWHQQFVHHDIWDYDLAGAPVLIEVRRNGQVIPAVAQLSKMALMFIFNRETGEPIFGVEERPVPQTNVPGEWTSPTQPFPVKPAPLSRNSIKSTELAKVTPEHEAFCKNLWETQGLRDSEPYQPWRTDANTVVFPGAQGGSNWWGMTYNPSLGLIFSNVHNAGQWGKLVPSTGGRGGEPPAPGTPPGFSKTPGPFSRFWNNENMWSCTAPPWGELVAINANTGDVAWRVPLGEFEELTAKGVPPTGTPNSGGSIATAGNLVFIGATIDGWFRAFDARNGNIVWKDKLPQPSQGTPTTYMGRDGKQYVVIGANGGGFFQAPNGEEIIAYSLP